MPDSFAVVFFKDIAFAELSKGASVDKVKSMVATWLTKHKRVIHFPLCEWHFVWGSIQAEMKQAVMEKLVKDAEEKKHQEKENSDCDQELGEEEPHTEDPAVPDDVEEVE